jgi:hypothetical protein
MPGGLGAAIGVAGGLALTRLLRSMLYGVSATDPAVFAGASFLSAVGRSGRLHARATGGTDGP